MKIKALFFLILASIVFAGCQSPPAAEQTPIAPESPAPESAEPAKPAAPEEPPTAAPPESAQTAEDAARLAELFEAAEQARKAAEESKARADSVKAGNAKKAEYAEALGLYKRGVEKVGKGQPEDAIRDFNQAQASFEELYVTVSTLREEALRAMRSAEQKAQEVEDFAVQADAIAPLADEDQPAGESSEEASE
jgi:hypothetical protein